MAVGFWGSEAEVGVGFGVSRRMLCGLWRGGVILFFTGFVTGLFRIGLVGLWIFILRSNGYEGH